MEKEFVPYELAVKLKEMGFDGKCLCSYSLFNNPTGIVDKILLHIPSGTYSNLSPLPYYGVYSKRTISIVKAPLWQQAFDFFREEKGLSSCIIFNGSEQYYWWITENTLFGIDINSIDDNVFIIYQEARLQCLIKLIEICEK